MRPIFLHRTRRERWLERLRDLATAAIAGLVLGWLTAQGF